MKSCAELRQTLNIVIAIYDPTGRYTRHAGVLCESILSNTDSKVCVHILHDDTLTSTNKSNLQTVVESHSQEINFVDVTESIKNINIDIDKITQTFTRGSIFRLLIPNIINLSKVIYLDCDIVVNLDINELWKADISNKSIAGVPHLSSKNKCIKTDNDTQILGNYINSGVLLMNLERIRETHSLIEEAISFFKNTKSELPDQDFLNMIFKDDILYLDNKFNYEPKESDKLTNLHGHIWHFLGFVKPWNMFTGAEAEYLYWNYLSQTPWKDELIKSMMKAAQNQRFYHRHSKDCINRLIKQLIDNIKALKNIFRHRK